ncbi:MAG: hypothetical protein AAFZ38_11410 [Myxococcota bacterium]
MHLVRRNDARPGTYALGPRPRHYLTSHLSFLLELRDALDPDPEITNAVAEATHRGEYSVGFVARLLGITVRFVAHSFAGVAPPPTRWRSKHRGTTQSEPFGRL